MLLEKPVGHPWLASELGDDGSDAHMHIGNLVKDVAQSPEIIGHPAHVGGNEVGVRMLFEHIVLLLDNLLPGCRIRIRTFATRMRLQLKPAFVLIVMRLPKRLWDRQSG